MSKEFEYAAHVLEQVFLNADGHLPKTNDYDSGDIVDSLRLAVRVFRESAGDSLEEHLQVFLKEYYNYDYPKQYKEGTGSSAMPHIVESAIHFAKWQKRQSINKACRYFCDSICEKSLAGMCFHKYDGQGQIKSTFRYEECNELKMLRKEMEE